MSHETVKVHVVNYGRATLYMRYLDPTTGKHVARSTGTKKQAEAEKAAGKWEAELREGRFKPRSRITWAEFRRRYEDEALSALANGSAERYGTVLDDVESTISPARPADMTAEKISQWQQSLRARKLSENTIRSYSSTLRAALNWAHEVGMVHHPAKVRMPARATVGKVMKGRPITTEEFDRMLAKVSLVVTGKRPQGAAERVAGWEFTLRGLWWSGLRLGEALALTWDGRELSIDLAGKRPMLRISAGSEKGHKDRILPLAPEAAEFFLAVPEAHRTGFVFNPLSSRGTRLPAREAGRVISLIGEKAGVKVNEGTYKGRSHVKFASAHDLRRAFGLRWAGRVMPAVLQQLMRHENIETTLRYYVGSDADGMAEILYAAVPKAPLGNSSGNSAPQHEEAADQACDANHVSG
ncbi:site-specific tyrosine recombinase XerC [Caulifigura coniformis]|uniref:Site-specific tyrosine recombinase XerC n=1 Tax=Caulifigura coniformis TaxID=2527983 RepID=A0A517SHI2_9PLAN|nr:site-specific integrase [Caulifigura coniformis]QDT55586.1 site-specific tyrosine recombinase XerC [Caulifigura coniformis]